MAGDVIDLKSFNRYFSGDNRFTIPTPQILELNRQITEWIDGNACGAIIHGKSRSGKTRSIVYITEHLKREYGNALPIIIINANSSELSHAPTQKAFYQKLLVDVRHEDPYKGTTVQLRTRLMNRLIECALDTKYRRIVFFIDEAYQLDEKEYNWLIDIYNELAQNNILLTVFLFGTRELVEQKRGFVCNKKEQIVLRFMSREFEFHGIRSLKELSICLASLDTPFVLDGREIIISESFFPEAYNEGKRMMSWARDLWEAFQSVRAAANISEKEVLMVHFMETVRYCITKNGRFGKALFEPGVEEWIEAVKESGYDTTQM